MKPLILVAAFAAVLFSCSKPSQENTATPDSTAVVDETTNQAEEVKRTPTTLTADEIERAKVEIFLFLRRDIPVSHTAFVEDIVFNGDKFKYTCMIHNGDNAGMNDNSYEGQYFPSQEEIEAYEKDTINTPSPYGNYTRHEYYFTPEIDTFYFEGTFIAYLDSAPEETPRRVTLEVLGQYTHTNLAHVDQNAQEVTFTIDKWEPAQCEYCENSDRFIQINFAEERKFNREELYLKAKVTEFSEKDVAGLTKEDLGYVRNEIFARHGHTFKTQKLIQRYVMLGWYQAVIDDASKVLNKFEKRNVDFLKKREG